MGILDRFKKQKEELTEKQRGGVVDDVKKAPKKVEKPEKKADKSEKKGKGILPTRKKAESAGPKLAVPSSKVLMRPLITEKATMTGTYVFEVAPETNKAEVRKEVKRVYGVEPMHVRMMNVGGKVVRMNNREGQRKSWKKAIVRLPKGEAINVYEGT
ncbi:MAG: 50S ribosomal protein L23 [Candidatus Kerfeldbacteria bacterium]